MEHQEAPKAIIKNGNYVGQVQALHVMKTHTSENFVILAGERIPQIGVKTIQRILAEILHFIP